MRVGQLQANFSQERGNTELSHERVVNGQVKFAGNFPQVPE